MKRFLFAFALFGLYWTTASAAVLEVVAVDYGVANQPATGILRPGDQGDIFITVKNQFPFSIHNVELNAYRGDCLDTVDAKIHIESMAAGEERRIEQPIRTQLSGACGRGSVAQFLLLGSYVDELNRPENIWANGQFVIWPIPMIDHEFTNIGLPIPDQASVRYSFKIEEDYEIEEMEITVSVFHSYAPDLALNLTHPDGTVIQLVQFMTTNDMLFSTSTTIALPAVRSEELRSLIGKNSGGEWTLELRDQSAADEGQLMTVRIHIKAKQGANSR